MEEEVVAYSNSLLRQMQSKGCCSPRLIIADYHRFQNASTEINHAVRPRIKPYACPTHCTTYIIARSVPKAGIPLDEMLPPQDGRVSKFRSESYQNLVGKLCVNSRIARQL
jgi:hypothetical protein